MRRFKKDCVASVLHHGRRPEARQPHELRVIRATNRCSFSFLSPLPPHTHFLGWGIHTQPLNLLDIGPLPSDKLTTVSLIGDGLDTRVHSTAIAALNSSSPLELPACAFLVRARNRTLNRCPAGINFFRLPLAFDL